MTSKSNRLRTIYGRVIALSMLVLLFVSTTGCKQERPAVPMTAGSFNIWCGVIDTGAFPWKTRCEQIAALIRFHDYDIIGMQEVRPEQMADLGKALPEYTAVGTGRDGNGQGEHSPVFFRTERYALLDSGTFWLSERPDTVSIGWDAAYNRICTWVKLNDRYNDKEFYYFNTHLDHLGPAARHNGALLICDRIQEKAANNYPIFCSGDFNAEWEADPIKVMREHLTSSREASQTSPYDLGNQISYNGVPVGQGSMAIPDTLDGHTEIDYVFVNDRVDVLKYGILRDSDGKYYPSDHYPILIKAELK